MPMSAANTTMLVSAIADISLLIVRVVTASTLFLPALYPGRTRHYHIKVQAPERPVLTTQLYFPDEPANRRDGLFRRELVMRITEASDSLAAHFDFVLDMR